jgi:hypothetical protein
MNPALYMCTLPRELPNIYEFIYNYCIISDSQGLSRDDLDKFNAFLRSASRSVDKHSCKEMIVNVFTNIRS